MDKRKEDNLPREKQEAAENKKVVVVDVPDTRMQDDQQVSNASEDAKTEPDTSESPYRKKKKSAPASVVKQDVAAQVVTSAASGPQSDSVPLAAAQMLGALQFSGNEGTIAGSTASTPTVGKSTRPEDRFGKKTESITKFLDYVPSEQIVTESDGSKPLAEQKDEVQGYNGTIRNENALSQKNAGNVPGALNYQRSLDEIALDLVYFARGQVNKQQGIVYRDVPQFTYFTGKYADFEEGVTPAYDKDGIELDVSGWKESDYYGHYVVLNWTRGNFLPRFFNLTVTNGKISSFGFDVLNASNSLSSDVTNRAATHELMHINSCELARQRIDAEAGDEVTSKFWSALPRAVAEPSATIALLDDVEAMIGDEVFTCYKKVTSSLAYQINATRKNGMHPARSMRQALLGCIVPEHSSAVYAVGGITDVFNEKWYQFGAASLAIAINDSTPKYNSLGKLLSMPLSVKSYLQVADNNMNAFRMDSLLAGVENSKEMFSTIDHDYDAVSPVFVTDKSAIIYPLDWNDLYSYTVDSNGKKVFNKPQFTYAYSGLRSNYQVTVAFPLLKGLEQFIESKMDNFTKAMKAQSFTLRVPIVHSTKYISLWDLLICGATKFMQEVRTNSLMDIIRLQEHYSYPFTELVPIKEANPMNNANYTNKDYQTPLGTKTLLPSAAITVVYPELFTPIAEDGSREWYRLPWYFSEREFDITSDAKASDNSGNPDTTTLSLNHDAVCISYPTVRSGVRSSYIDMIYSMSERDVRLCLDRIVDITNGGTITGACVYKYDTTSDGIPCIAGDELGMTIDSFLSLPRELGLSLVPPAGLLTPVYFNGPTGSTATFDATTKALLGVLNGDISVEDNSMDQFYLTTGESLIRKWFPCHRLSYFFSSKSEGAIPTETYSSTKGLFGSEQINISLSTAFRQDWNSYPALPNYCCMTNDPGFRMSLAECFTPTNEVIDGVSKFVPYCVPSTGGTDVQVSNHNLYAVSLQKALWTRLQRLPIALSPWDVAAALKKAGAEDGVHYDSFDFMYMLGFQGMRASDYREDLYNKENDIINLGYNYIHDRFVEDSPVFKDAMRYTVIGK